MIATKEQERKTLEKIKQMVADLGGNSYLAAAFTGAFELAEQNIENDWGCTTQEYIDKASKATEIENRASEEITRLKAELEAVRKAHIATSENFDATAERASKYAYEIDDLKEALKAARLETITLKARLYDYMIKEQAGA